VIIQARVQFLITGDSGQEIIAIGGYNPEGRLWKLFVPDAIIGRNAGWWRFYLKLGQTPIEVTVRKSADGSEFLTTEAGDKFLHALPHYSLSGAAGAPKSEASFS
jgi:hypothetical protein